MLKINKDTEVMLAKQSTEWMLLVVHHSFGDTEEDIGESREQQ